MPPSDATIQYPCRSLVGAMPTMGWLSGAPPRGRRRTAPRRSRGCPPGWPARSCWWSAPIRPCWRRRSVPGPASGWAAAMVTTIAIPAAHRQRRSSPSLPHAPTLLGSASPARCPPGLSWLSARRRWKLNRPAQEGRPRCPGVRARPLDLRARTLASGRSGQGPRGGRAGGCGNVSRPGTKTQEETMIGRAVGP